MHTLLLSLSPYMKKLTSSLTHDMSTFVLALLFSLVLIISYMSTAVCGGLGIQMVNLVDVQEFIVKDNLYYQWVVRIYLEITRLIFIVPCVKTFIILNHQELLLLMGLILELLSLIYFY